VAIFDQISPKISDYFFPLLVQYVEINTEIILVLYAARHQTFEASKVCKNASSIQQWAFYTILIHIKKTAALCFVC